MSNISHHSTTVQHLAEKNLDEFLTIWFTKLDKEDYYDCKTSSRGVQRDGDRSEMSSPGGGQGSGNSGSHFTTPKRTGRKSSPRHQKSQDVAPEVALRVRREALGLSRARLADETELPISQIWRAENEGNGVDDETRATIVDVLNRYRDSIANLPPLT